MKCTARLWLVVVLSLSLVFALGAFALAQEEDTAALEQKTADEAFAKADKATPTHPGKVRSSPLQSWHQVLVGPSAVPITTGARTLNSSPALPTTLQRSPSGNSRPKSSLTWQLDKESMMRLPAPCSSWVTI